MNASRRLAIAIGVSAREYKYVSTFFMELHSRCRDNAINRDRYGSLQGQREVLLPASEWPTQRRASKYKQLVTDREVDDDHNAYRS